MIVDGAAAAGEMAMWPFLDRAECTPSQARISRAT